MDKEIKIGYDREGDLLEIFFEDPVPAIGEEVIPGVFVHRACDDERVVAVSVSSLTRRFKDLSLLTIPFRSTLPDTDLDELIAQHGGGFVFPPEGEVIEAIPQRAFPAAEPALVASK